MTLIVLLTCCACASYTRVSVPGQPCPAGPSHVHVKADDPQVVAWYASHHDPEMEVLGHVSTT